MHLAVSQRHAAYIFRWCHRELSSLRVSASLSTAYCPRQHDSSGLLLVHKDRLHPSQSDTLQWQRSQQAPLQPETVVPAHLGLAGNVSHRQPTMDQFGKACFRSAWLRRYVCRRECRHRVTARCSGKHTQQDCIGTQR